MDAKAEKIARFRYGLIAPLVLETLPRGELTRRAEEIAARSYDIPHSQRHSLSVDTLLDWALRYRRGGFAALAKQPRRDRGQSRALTPQLAELIERLKRENPHGTGATLLRELALVSTVGTVSPATLYRFLKQRGLTAPQQLAPAARKTSEAEFSNQIWQSDLPFGPHVQRASAGPMSSPGHIRPRWTNPVLWRRPDSEREADQQTLPMDEKSGTIALFRFGLIAPIVLERSLPAREFTRRAREIAARDYDIPYSKRTSVSVDTVLDWVFRYREGGFEALVRKSRGDRRQFRTIAPLTADLIERLKRENPNLTGTALLHELRLSSGHDSSGMSAATLYRFIKQRGLSARQLTADAPLKRLKRNWRIDFISDEDRGLLTEWRRSKDKNLWQKAVTVLENSNLSPEDIAKKVERPLSCIRQWIKAFKCGGIKVLNPARKPRLFAADLRATLDQKRRWILEILHTRPRFYAINRSNWNLRSLFVPLR
jgi:transposase